MNRVKEKYDYLESIAPLLLSHGMVKKDNIISCELLDKEILLLLDFISEQNLSQNRLIDYVEKVKNDTLYLRKCYIGEQLRVELNEKVGREWFVYDMYRLLEQLDAYQRKNNFGNEFFKTLDEYKKEELYRNSIVGEINGSFSALVLSRRGIVIQ